MEKRVSEGKGREKTNASRRYSLRGLTSSSDPPTHHEGTQSRGSSPLQPGSFPVPLVPKRAEVTESPGQSAVRDTNPPSKPDGLGRFETLVGQKGGERDGSGKETSPSTWW